MIIAAVGDAVVDMPPVNGAVVDGAQRLAGSVAKAAFMGIAGCTLEGRHSHSGVSYCGDHHSYGFCEGVCH